MGRTRSHRRPCARRSLISCALSLTAAPCLSDLQIDRGNRTRLLRRTSGERLGVRGALPGTTVTRFSGNAFSCITKAQCRCLRCPWRRYGGVRFGLLDTGCVVITEGLCADTSASLADSNEKLRVLASKGRHLLENRPFLSIPAQFPAATAPRPLPPIHCEERVGIYQSKSNRILALEGCGCADYLRRQGRNLWQHLPTLHGHGRNRIQAMRLILTNSTR
jgi:hypothetical protein